MMKTMTKLLAGAAAAISLSGCATMPGSEPLSPEGLRYAAQPLVTEIYTADPSAHVFNNRLYIYGSHDLDGPAVEDDLGSHFEMRDYRVISMDRPGAPVTVHPVALDVDQVPWAARQMWAPDAAYKNGRYYLYFPAKDAQDVFRIGVAVGDRPEGPFTPQPEAIRGSYSIDPAVFTDDDGQSYMCFGGIWGGQLQRWQTGQYQPNGSITDLAQPNAPAIKPRIARMRNDMLEFAEAPREVMILDESGNPILGGDLDRRFFEAAWVQKYNGLYYFSYSTGDTDYINYATGTSSLWAIHLSRAGAGAGAGVDQPSFDHRGRWAVLSVLPRYAAFERHAAAQHQDAPAAAQYRWVNPDA